MRALILSGLVLALLGPGCAGELVTGPGNGNGDGTGDGDGNGGGDGDGDGDGSAPTSAELFEALNPQQLIECGACHLGANVNDTATGPDYLGPSADLSLDTLLAYRSHQDGSPLVGNSPENSKLYFYGVHAGPALSPALAEQMAEWIEVRAAENGGGGGDDGGDDDGGEDPPPTGGEPTTLVDAMTRYANCMTYADFQAAQFENVAAQNTASGQCYSCHNVGTGGAYLSQDPSAFYDNQRKMPFILKFATGTVKEDGSFGDVVQADRYELKQADNGHPNYLMDPARVAAIDQFFATTYTRYRNSIDTGTPCTPDVPPITPPQ